MSNHRLLFNNFFMIFVVIKDLIIIIDACTNEPMIQMQLHSNKASIISFEAKRLYSEHYLEKC